MQSLWMIAASFFFAGMGVCVKLASARYSAAEIVFYRSFLNLLFIWALVKARGIPVRTPLWGLHIRRSACGCFSLILYFYAIGLLPLASAVTLSYTSPLFLALYLAMLGKTRLRGGMVFSLALGFAGVVMLLHPSFRADQLFGGVMGLTSGMISGMAYYNIRELGERGELEERIVFYFALVCTLVGAIWMLFFEFQPIDPEGGALLLGVGLFGTAGQLVMTRAYKLGNTLMTACLAYTTVVFASLFGALFWREILSVDAWLAIALIVASGVVATWFSRANPADQD
ncbi:MAG: DMT family transporter [Candidatus Accumulibacter sp.]|jgi:S-adenosylmethionine uptake transporter|nr:DMT family transporter [Accumulibacter sp.]